MAFEHSIARYRKLYAKLLRLYPKSHRERFGEGMEQTFNDLCRERQKAGSGLFGFALWMYAETSAGIFREHSASFIMRNKNIIWIALAVASLLLIPLLGGADWDETDYIVAGGLLFGTGVAFELVARNARTRSYRFAVAIALGAALLLTWINLAVGVIGNENNPANLMYFGVLAIGFLGAIIARFKPQGMARAMFATAIAQALVPVLALIIWRPPINMGVMLVFGLNAFFVALFVGSALLFRHAASKQPTEIIKSL